jgi:methyl coenzyme M reductase subunit D
VGESTPSFGNPKHMKKKLLNVHDNSLELKIHFESKLNLIQWLDEKDRIKSICIKYLTYFFSMAIGPHVCDS